MTDQTHGVLAATAPDTGYLAYCACNEAAWLGETRSCPIEARADLLVHRAMQHGESL